MRTLIEFKHVTKKYSDRLVLQNLSFRLQEGEVIVFLGPSGCGKTTALHIATKIAKATSGEVNIHTTNIGYVFQEPRLLPWKTAIENVRFGMKTSAVQREQALQQLEKVGLAHVADAYPRQLSGGMKQRVSVARALAVNPELIVMDEPFSALDMAIKTELQEDVIRIIEDFNVGVLYVTHDYQEAIKMADRILLLHDIQNGICKEICLDRSRLQRDAYYISEQITIINQLIGGCMKNA